MVKWLEHTYTYWYTLVQVMAFEIEDKYKYGDHGVYVTMDILFVYSFDPWNKICIYI